VLNHCHSWDKFVNTHLSHSRQWFNSVVDDASASERCYDDVSDDAESGSYTVTADGHVDDNDSLYRPRLCELRSWSDFDGYGFDLHANDENQVKYIGKIDQGSPAEAAGKSIAFHGHLVQ